MKLLTNTKERLPALALRLVRRWLTQPEWRVHFVYAPWADGFMDVAAWTRSGAIAKAERLEKAQAYGCEGPIYPWTETTSQNHVICESHENLKP